ncbi:MAG: hypothetical protein HKN49_05965, partial [Gammaproteobacteria bacterium]|nr:hypothetical protein [Gammaproteobacteria bacterium]
GSCRRSTDGGETTSSIGSTTSQRRNWLTPLVFDPNDPAIMYYAGNIVNRSVSGGAGGWAAISPELTDGDPFPGSDEPYPFGTITTVAPAASNGNTLYVGTDDAKLWYTHDLGVNWTQSSDPDLPNRWVSRIVVDPTDASVAYATYSGFRNGDNTPYVFKTVDGGANWDDITSNLPQAPVNGIALYNDSLIIINDGGVYISDNDGVTWDFLGTGLPNVPVMDLRVHAPTNTLHIATFGRGMWKTTIPAPDFDDDGLVNSADNCIEVANPDQCDTNNDGFGNLCDGDLDNNNIVNTFDLNLLRSAMGSTGSNDADLDCNNIVNSFDLTLMRNMFGKPPGPSGVAP